MKSELHPAEESMAENIVNQVAGLCPEHLSPHQKSEWMRSAKSDVESWLGGAGWDRAFVEAAQHYPEWANKYRALMAAIDDDEKVEQHLSFIDERIRKESVRLWEKMVADLDVDI